MDPFRNERVLETMDFSRLTFFKEGKNGSKGKTVPSAGEVRVKFYGMCIA